MAAGGIILKEGVFLCDRIYKLAGIVVFYSIFVGISYFTVAGNGNGQGIIILVKSLFINMDNTVRKCHQVRIPVCVQNFIFQCGNAIGNDQLYQIMCLNRLGSQRRNRFSASHELPSVRPGGTQIKMNCAHTIRLTCHSLSTGKKILVSASSRHSTAAPPRKMIQVIYHAWEAKLMIK